jgi:hypothetical protein
MLAQILCTVYAMVWFIPSVFSVMKTNKGVMALFARVSKFEIENLISVSEDFLKQYLGDFLETSGSDSEDSDSEDSDNDASLEAEEIEDDGEGSEMEASGIYQPN